MDCLGNQLSPLDGSLYYASVPQTSFGRAMVGTKGIPVEPHYLAWCSFTERIRSSNYRGTRN
jgi:hypothetical protein